MLMFLSRTALVFFASFSLAVPIVAQQYQLRYNPEIGKTLRYSMEVVQDMNMNLGPMGEQKMVSTNTVESSITASKAAQGFEVKTVFDRMALDVRQGEQSMMNFDSAEGSTDDPALASVSAMVGKPFIMTVNQQGEITKVEGIDEMWAAAFEAVKNDPKASSMMQQLEQGMGGESMIQMMQAGMAVFPENSVKAGDSWDWSTTNINPMLGSMDVDLKYTLKGKSDAFTQPCLQIDVAMEMEFGGGGEMFDQLLAMSGGEGSLDVEDLDGSGSLCIAEKTGMVVHSEMSQDMKMSMSLASGGQQMNMKFDIKQKTLQRLID